MKTKLFFLLVFLGLFKHSQAQTFSLTSIDTLTVGPVGSVPSCHANIINNTSTGFYVDVLRLVNDTAQNWLTAYCLDVCYPPNVDSARVYVPANFTQGFLLEFFSDTFSDTSMVFMKFKNVSNPSNSFYQHYFGITDLTFGMNELAKNDVAVTMYPSPVISGEPFTFSISERQKSSEDFTLVISDVFGKRIRTLSGLLPGNNTLLLELPSGLYVYALMQNNQPAKTGKMAILR